MHVSTFLYTYSISAAAARFIVAQLPRISKLLILFRGRDNAYISLAIALLLHAPGEMLTYIHAADEYFGHIRPR